MILYVNEKNQIKDVDSTTNEKLTPLVVSDEDNPFKGWSVAKICCYKVEVVDEHVLWYSAYVDPSLIEHIDKLGQGIETNVSDITETYEKTIETDTTITDIQLAMTELYEMMLGGTQ